jgi:superoxide dismutase, Fe-Mn family
LAQRKTTSPPPRAWRATWAADHTMTLAGGTPLLALDMYEHAYHLDYGAKAGAYVDAFMAAIDWKNADTLFARAAA